MSNLSLTRILYLVSYSLLYQMNREEETTSRESRRDFRNSLRLFFTHQLESALCPSTYAWYPYAAAVLLLLLLLFLLVVSGRHMYVLR